MRKEFTAIGVILLLLAANGFCFQMLLLSGTEGFPTFFLTGLLCAFSLGLIYALALVSRRLF